MRSLSDSESWITSSDVARLIERGFTEIPPLTRGSCSVLSLSVTKGHGIAEASQPLLFTRGLVCLAVEVACSCGHRHSMTQVQRMPTV